MRYEMDQTKPPMARPAKAVIAQVLAESVTPLLKQHGFDRRGRVAYERLRDGRRELVTIQPEHCNKYGGWFTINLAIFIPEVDAVVSLYPLQEPPQDEDCHIRCPIGVVGPDGRPRAEPGGDDLWWQFDATTDLTALGAEVRQRVEENALRFFDNLRTGSGLAAWLREAPMSAAWTHLVALAAYAGETALAQQRLDDVLASGSSTSETPDWAGKSLRRQAAAIAGRLGLACPPLTDTPVLTVTFRVKAEATPQDRHRIFHELESKYRQYVWHFRTLLPAEDAQRLYHFAECTSDAYTIGFYGVDPDALLARLRRGFDGLSEQSAEVTWRVGP